MTTETNLIYGAGTRKRTPSPSRYLGPGLIDRFQQMITNAEAADAMPVGITATGENEPGLFPITRTGASTKAIKEAAEAFLAMLTPGQRDAARFDIDSPQWRRWSNIHVFLMRHGAMMDEMSGPQKEAGLDLLRATLSASGYQISRDIMRLNHTIGEITGSWTEYGEWCYWISIFGTPSMTEPWGWQIDGHHLILNTFILGDQVVMTPAFLGSEPVHALNGKYAGTRVLQAEEAKGLELMQALTGDQRERTALGDAASMMDGRMQAGAFRDNFVLPYEGIPAADLTAGQQELLLSLVQTYVGRMADGHAAVKMDEVKRHLDGTHFAWAGDVSDTGVYYYRVHSPVILIEFDHQRGVAFETTEPFRQHIHTIVRTPNGNDYGADLLAQHYARHHNGAS